MKGKREMPILGRVQFPNGDGTGNARYPVHRDFKSRKKCSRGISKVKGNCEMTLSRRDNCVCPRVMMSNTLTGSSRDI